MGLSEGQDVISKLEWGWRICFQDGSLTWLLSGGLSFSPCRLLQRLLECSHNMAAHFLGASDPGKRGNKDEASMF